MIPLVFCVFILLLSFSCHAINVAPTTQFEPAATAINSTQLKWLKHLQSSTILMGLTSITRAKVVSADCHSQLRQLEMDVLLRRPWAIKMLDATGTKPPGFIFGHNLWLGSRETCDAIQNPITPLLSKYVPHTVNLEVLRETAPFAVSYRVVYLQHNSTWQVDFPLVFQAALIHVGLCLPSSCMNGDITWLMSRYVESDLFVSADIYDMRPKVLYVKALTLKEEFYESKAYRIILAVLAFTITMMLCALILRVKEQSVSEQTALVENAVASAAADDRNNERAWKSFIKCFDVVSNWQRLYNLTGAEQNEFPIISGIRSFCAIFIIFAHSLYFISFSVVSLTQIMAHMNKIGNVALFVDNFFTISGFLQTYNFLRNEKQLQVIRKASLKQNIKMFLSLFLHRILRLVPPYAVTLVVTYLLYIYMNDVSVLHTHCALYENCVHYWWRNLLFIQDFYPDAELCLLWSWSLASEIHFSTLAIALLFTYAKHPRSVKIITVLLLLSGICWTFSQGLKLNFQYKMDSIFSTFTELYMHPLARSTPFMLGAIVGWYLAENQTKISMHKGIVKWLFDRGIFVYLALCAFKTNWDMPVLAAVSLLVGQRIVYSLLVCWAIVGSKCGCGNWWMRFCGAKIFYHINKLTYGFYLLNPLVIVYFCYMVDSAMQAKMFMLFVLAIGIVVIVYILSVIFTLAFEMPYCNWSRVITQRLASKLKVK